MTKWTGHDGSSDCPTSLRGTRHKVETIIYEKVKDGKVMTYDLPFEDAGYIGCWRNVAAWRVVEPTLDERLLKYLEETYPLSPRQCTHLEYLKLIEELKERIAKDD